MARHVNWSQHHSWEGRCTGAGLSLNEGPVWGPTCWKKAVSVPANTVYKSYATTLTRVVKQDCKRKSAQQTKQQCEKSQQTSIDDSSKSSYSRYYGGPNAIVPQGITPNHLQDHMINFYKTKVVIIQQRTRNLQPLTMQHGSSGFSLTLASACCLIARKFRVQHSVYTGFHLCCWSTFWNGTSY